MISIIFIIFWFCSAIYFICQKDIKMALICVLFFRLELDEEAIRDLQHKVEKIEVVK